MVGVSPGCTRSSTGNPPPSVPLQNFTRRRPRGDVTVTTERPPSAFLAPIGHGPPRPTRCCWPHEGVAPRGPGVRSGRRSPPRSDGAPDRAKRRLGRAKPWSAMLVPTHPSRSRIESPGSLALPLAPRPIARAALPDLESVRGMGGVLPRRKQTAGRARAQPPCDPPAGRFESTLGAVRYTSGRSPWRATGQKQPHRHAPSDYRAPPRVVPHRRAPRRTRREQANPGPV